MPGFVDVLPFERPSKSQESVLVLLPGQVDMLCR